METRRTERLIIEEVNPNEARYAYVHSGCIAYSGEGTINLPDMGIGCYIGGTVRGRSRICSEKAMAKR